MSHLPAHVHAWQKYEYEQWWSAVKRRVLATSRLQIRVAWMK